MTEADLDGDRDAVAPGLVALALRGLSAMDLSAGREVPYTLRGVPGAEGPELRPQGLSLRYSAIVALGLSRHPLEAQRAALGGTDAAAFARWCLDLARESSDLGAVALALWAAGEAGQTTDRLLAARLLTAVQEHTSVATVDCSWAVMAGLAMATGQEGSDLALAEAERLVENQGAQGTFPHALPGGGGLRGHIGSFADQIYPIQALARYAARVGDATALAAADLTAQQIVRSQGPAGQWWWHYDVRTGHTVERYPVYSVHQHGMAPMALSELTQSGGTNHSDAIERGFSWLQTHPECIEPMIAPALGVVWRKVGRGEPFKAARAIGALASRIRPHSTVSAIERLWPPGVVDYECRPYELGWLLYANKSAVQRRGHE